MADRVFDLSPTQSRFVHTDAHVAILQGPMGEGKTFAGVVGLIRHADRCGRDIRGALIRDTHTNLKISTVPDIKEMLGSLVSFHDDDRKMVIHTTPKVEMDLFGIDDTASLSKLQGPQYAIVWLEEPCPIEEKANAGLPRAVFDLSIARAARQRDTILRVQITMNPGEEDHWTEEIIQGPRVLATDQETGAQIIKEVLLIPYRDNSHLSSLSRAANIAAFQHDEAKFKRYVQGQAAASLKGKKVTPGYNSAIHYAADELPVIPGATGVRFWDGWHHPACLVGQWVPPGRLIIHAALRGEDAGVAEFIPEQVMPLLMQAKYRDKITDWRDIGDPSMSTPDQSTRRQTTAKTVEHLLRTKFERGPTRWNSRIEPLKHALGSFASDGNPVIMVSRSAYHLHRALNGGWHWKTNNSGNRIGTVPVKDASAEFGDSMSYGVAILRPVIGLRKPQRRQNPGTIPDDMRIAMSYAPSPVQGF